MKGDGRKVSRFRRFRDRSRKSLDIFTPYFTTKGERGTGLGLAVSKAIVERHGGTIRVRSNIQSGTTFRLSLPTQVAAVLA
jgi:signal transduction histidine kinase